MSDFSKPEEGEEEAEASTSPLLTFIVGIIVIGLAFFMAFSPILERIFG